MKKSKWESMVNKRKKELQEVKTTRSFIKYEKLSSRLRKYYIHDNGGRPFYVTAGIPKNKDTPVITIYGHSGFDSEYNHIYKKMKTIKNFIGYWSGFDSSPYKFHGNTLLIKLSERTYIGTGRSIFQFSTPEPILDYISPVGNNDVPYPVAYTKNYVIFMLDNVYVPKTSLRLEATVLNSDNIYSEYYGHIYGDTHKTIKDTERPLKSKIILKLRMGR